MKFDRCFDSECVKFKLLSEDYSKVSIKIRKTLQSGTTKQNKALLKFAHSGYFRLSFFTMTVMSNSMPSMENTTKYAYPNSVEISTTITLLVISTLSALGKVTFNFESCFYNSCGFLAIFRDGSKVQSFAVILPFCFRCNIQFDYFNQI